MVVAVAAVAAVVVLVEVLVVVEGAVAVSGVCSFSGSSCPVSGVVGCSGQCSISRRVVILPLSLSYHRQPLLPRALRRVLHKDEHISRGLLKSRTCDLIIFEVFKHNTVRCYRRRQSNSACVQLKCVAQ